MNEFGNILNSLKVIDNMNILFFNNYHFNLQISKGSIGKEIISHIYIIWIFLKLISKS